MRTSWIHLFRPDKDQFNLNLLLVNVKMTEIKSNGVKWGTWKQVKVHATNGLLHACNFLDFYQ